MKKIESFILTLSILLLIISCTKDIQADIASLRKQTSELESMVSDYNATLSSLSELISAFESNDFIKSVKQVLDKNGKLSYQIDFVGGSSITLNDGSKGIATIIGIRQEVSSGYYYWTVKSGENGAETWLTDATGIKIRADGLTPRLKLESGFWWVSYDYGTNWTKLNAAVPTDGQSIFSDINISDSNIAIFTLSSGETVMIPTYQCLDNLLELCTSMNEGIEQYTKLASDFFAATPSVTSVEELSEGGNIAGYKLNLSDGTSVTVNNGKSAESPEFLIMPHYMLGKNCMWIRYPGEIITLLEANGSPVIVDPSDDVQPRIGIADDTTGTPCFVVSYGVSDTTFIKGADGNHVKAIRSYDFNIFNDVDLSNPRTIVLSTVDGLEITLPRFNRISSPLFADNVKTLFAPGDSTEVTRLRCDTLYSVTVSVRDTVYGQQQCIAFSEYKAINELTLRAICMENGNVQSVTEPSEIVSSDVDGGFAYSFDYKVTFKTAAAFSDPDKTRLALFLSWGENRNSMKVVTYRPEPETEPEE